MFDKSSRFYDDFYSYLDYETAAETLTQIVGDRHNDARSLLDVACGTGKYISFLRDRFDVEGLDINAVLLQKLIERYPDVPAHRCDMVDFELGRQFDVVVCLFCSIAYAVTAERAQQAIASMAAHLKPGGLLIVEPWIAPDQCWTDKVTSEVLDRADLKIVRMHTHEKRGATSVYDIHYLVGTPQKVEHFVERETMGLFTRDQYRSFFTTLGLEYDYLDVALFPGHKYGLHIAKAAS